MCQDQPHDPIVTPKMVEAGVYEAREHALGESLSELVLKVYLAMAIEAKESDEVSGIIKD